jgi:hypothetical protein
MQKGTHLRSRHCRIVQTINTQTGLQASKDWAFSGGKVPKGVVCYSESENEFDMFLTNSIH